MTTAYVEDHVDFDRFGDYAPPSPKRPADPAAFERPRYRFQGRISTDGSTQFPAEAGRYHLYFCHACPWAQRSAIVRSLKGLENVVSMSAVDPLRDARGWAFRSSDGGEPDPVNGFSFLSEAYEKTEPGYDGHVSVPVLWDKVANKMVSNNFPDISIDLGTKFDAFGDPAVDTYPQALRGEIDELNELIYHTVNDGVYRCGFSRSQADYEANVQRVFATLDQLEERLSTRRYLFGPTVTESDVRLWVTLARFDAVYYSHFKVNLRRIVDYPNLWGYARDLYSIRAFKETTDFERIKKHYYMTHGHINPTRIVPAGPIIDWDEPHGREALG